MSEAMKCDRCGACYERGGEWLIRGKQRNSLASGRYDLCADCAEGFARWADGVGRDAERMRQAEAIGEWELRCEFLESECDGLEAEVARLTDELAKRDKGIERLRRRRGELVDQVRELTDRVAQLESGQRTAPLAHAVASNDVEIYRAKLGRVLDAIHEIEREVRNG